MKINRQIIPWIPAIFIAVVFVQSLFFKFSNSFETQHIFGVIGLWMNDIGISSAFSDWFARYGGYTVGGVELIAAGLLLSNQTRRAGALLSLGVISGAIFFHLVTPLGVSVVINEAGDRDGGQLFAMAVAVFLSSLYLLFFYGEQTSV